jgi:CDP-diacylglycerol--glycerol-3-phosphate 3-phosphatidyltransferase
MPSVYDLKPRFQALLRPVMRGLARAGWRPNGVTLAALSGSVVVGGALTRATSQPALLLLLPLWLFVRMALNAIDGMMARELDMATPLGAVLNELGDVLSDLALYLPLALFSDPARWAVIAFAVGALLTEFCGLLGSALGAGRRYEGPMGKSDRAFVVGLLAVVTFTEPRIGLWWPHVFWVASALTGLTCWNRVSKTLHH